MGATSIGAPVLMRVGNSELIGIAALVVLGILGAVLWQRWATAGLRPYEGDVSTLRPLVRRETSDRQARAMGVRTVAWFVVLSIVLTIPQGIVAVTDGDWWAWCGLAMFGTTTVHFAIMLRRLLRERGRAWADQGSQV